MHYSDIRAKPICGVQHINEEAAYLRNQSVFGSYLTEINTKFPIKDVVTHLFASRQNQNQKLLVFHLKFWVCNESLVNHDFANLFISKAFTSDNQCPKIPNFILQTCINVQ